MMIIKVIIIIIIIITIYQLNTNLLHKAYTFKLMLRHISVLSASHLLGARNSFSMGSLCFILCGRNSTCD